MADQTKYKNKRWKHLRKAILNRDKFKCQECKGKGNIITADTVHHCDPNNLEVFYNSENLISLCNACHEKMHNRKTDKLTELGEKWLLRSKRGLIPKIKI